MNAAFTHFAPHSIDEYFVLQDEATDFTVCGVIEKTAHNGQLSEKRSFKTVADRNGEDER